MTEETNVLDKVNDEQFIEEVAEKLGALAGVTPTPEEKQSIFTFLTNVALAEDTTKLGNLREEELGMPIMPVRSDKSLALWCGDVMDNPFFERYFLKESEDTTSTSLSRDGFLDKLAVLQKREVADLTKPKKVNKGWFGQKNKDKEEQ